MKPAPVFLTVILMLSLVPLQNGSAEGSDIAIAPQDPRRSTEILYTFEPPVLDGYIDAREWQILFNSNYYDAFDQESFQEIYNTGGPEEEFTNQTDLSVTFYLLYDDTYLYFAANVTDDAISIDSGSTYWRDDGIELLIDGAHDMDVDQRAGDPWPGYEDGTTLLAVADGSTFHDYSSGTPYERSFGESGDWFASTRTAPGEGYYIVEMRLRLDAVASPLPNATIGFNVGVNDDDTGGDSKTALKWEGNATGPGENPTFKNETLWGEARFVPYVDAELPDRYYFDEDTEVVVPGNLSVGNHPDFLSDSNFTWEVPIFSSGVWRNVTRFGDVFRYTFDEPRFYYTLKLTVRDPSGVEDAALTYLYINDITPPEIVETDDIALEEVPFTYLLNATDNVEINNVSWSLYDGEWINRTSFSTSFTHTFQHPGRYTLGFRVFDSSDNSAWGNSTITVLDNVPPIVGMMPDRTMNTTHPAGFNATGAYDDTEDGPSTDLVFNWTFTSGEHVFRFQGREAVVSIPIPGEYNCSLVVTDKRNLSTVRYFMVSVEDTTPPVPDLQLPSIVEEGRTLSLTANLTIDNDPLFWQGAVINWRINCLEPEFEVLLSGRDTSFTFPLPGIYTIGLFVTDPSGNGANVSRTVEAVDITPPQISVNIPEQVDQGSPLYINLEGSKDNAGILAIHYKLYRLLQDDQAELVLETPPFGIRVRNVTPAGYQAISDLFLTLDEPGSYRLNITMEDINGLSSSVFVTFQVMDKVAPTAVLNRTYVVVRIGEMLLLSAYESSDEYGPLTFEWYLDGELQPVGGAEFGFVFNKVAEHNITLVVFDGNGNNDTAQCRVIVISETEEQPKDDINETLIFLWVVAAAVIVLGTIFIFIWARSKRASRKRKTEEE
ncbi:MAG: PKD domain-containing protein [Thermoplasmatota archaeon]